VGVFSKKPTPERELAALQDRKAAIDTRASEARTALQAAHDRRRVLLTGGETSDAEVASHDEICRAAESRLVARRIPLRNSLRSERHLLTVR
jgi:hypothetical protein